MRAAEGALEKTGLRPGKTAMQVPLKILVNGREYGAAAHVSTMGLAAVGRVAKILVHVHFPSGQVASSGALTDHRPALWIHPWCPQLGWFLQP